MYPFSWARWLRSFFRPRRPQTYRKPVRRLSLERLEAREVPASHTWTGGGGNANWMTGQNWTGGAPSVDDDLVFPSGVTATATNNDFPANTNFNSITIS